MDHILVLLTHLLQLVQTPLALRQTLLQADDLVLQTLVQLLLVLNGLGLDLQLLESSSGQELSDLALNQNNVAKTSKVFSVLEPASNVSLKLKTSFS